MDMFIAIFNKCTLLQLFLVEYYLLSKKMKLPVSVASADDSCYNT